MVVNDLAVRVISRAEYDIDLEQVRGSTVVPDGSSFVHSGVRKWCPTTRRRYQHDIALLADLRGTPLFAFIHSDNAKLQKFAAMMGFAAFAHMGDGWEVWRRG